MELMAFVRDVGRKLFKSDEEAARSIKEHIDHKLSGIRDLEVSVEDGVATLCGECINEETKKSAILIAGHVKDVRKVVADGLNTPPPASEKVVKDDFYTIQSGDTLGAIARQYYGNASAYRRIFEANADIISDPNTIYPGQKIRIPLD